VSGPAASQSSVFGDVCPLLTSLLDGGNYDPAGNAQEQQMEAMYGPAPTPLPGESGEPRAFPSHGSHTTRSPVCVCLPPSACVAHVRRFPEPRRIRNHLGSGGRPRCVLPPAPCYPARVVLSTTCLICRVVGSASRLMELVRGGLQLRHVDSSRSHLIIIMTLTTVTCSDSTADQACSATLPREQTEAGRAGRSRSASLRAAQLVPGDPEECVEQVQARLQLVDLAGSKCIGVSGATGAALRETACINCNLAALADVLGTFVERRGHVPYRNGRPTQFLQDCDTKLLVILCRHLAQGLQGLCFGTRARRVQRGPARKRQPSSPAEGRMWPD
uniref:Kinesin motor domain-containing protein n=1 Tax=Aotus nancymaae TaxID=37293 RepID=A0A2K5ECU8_AOTNA